MTKLTALGIANKMLSRFTSFLSNRFQTVKVNYHYSEAFHATSEVLQGSLYFLLHINDVYTVIKECFFIRK